MIAKTSYITTDEADIYFQGKLEKDDWLNASIPERRAALIEASTILDQIDYSGQKANNLQEHEFPRYITIPLYDNVVYDTDLVPLEIKYATAEMALALLSGFERNARIEETALHGQTYGSAKIIYDRTGLAPYAKAGVTPNVWNLIQPLVRDHSSILISRV